MHISSDDNRLQYCGRIDFDDPKAPVFVYAASFVSIRFTGKALRSNWLTSVLIGRAEWDIY